MEPEKRDRLCHFFAFMFSLCIVTPVFYMLVDRRTPLIVESVTITPSPAKPTDVMTSRIKVREYRDCDGVVIRRFIGADHVIRETTSQPTVYHGPADGELREFEIQFLLPLLPPGRATYEPVTKRWCNVLQQYLWPIVTHVAPVEIMVK